MNLYMRDNTVCSISILHTYLSPQQIIPNKIWMMIKSIIDKFKSISSLLCFLSFIESESFVIFEKWFINFELYKKKTKTADLQNNKMFIDTKLIIETEL